MTTTMDRGQLRNVLFFALTTGLLVVVASRHDWGTWCLSRVTYFVVLAAVAAFLVRLATWTRARWESPLAALRASWPELALAAGAMVVLFLTHDWRFKVLSDETNLVSIGRSMAYEWRFDFPDASKFYYGTQHGSNYVFDKRPPLFGFVLGLVDALTGYRVRNVWLLNGAILGATVFVAAAFLKRRLGRPWNLLAAVWAIANPVVMLTSSGSGVEPLLGLLWAVAGVVMLDVLENPDEKSFGLFVTTLFLLGLTRLEAGPLGAMMLLAILVASPQRAKITGMLRDDPLVWLAPAVAMPIVLLQARNRDYFQGLTSKPFSLSYLVGNVGNWATILKDGGRYFPFSAVVTCVEVAAVVLLVVLVLSGRTSMSRAEKTAFLVFSALTSAFVALYSAYFWGQPTNPACARFYALPSFFAALAVPAILARAPAVKARPAVAAVAFALVFLHAFPGSHGRAFANAFTWRKQHHIVADYVQPLLPHQQLLIVSAVPSQFTIYDVGSVGYTRFKNGRDSYLNELARHLYDEILFVSEVKLADGLPTHDTTPPPDLTIETVLERQHTSTSFIRISRLKIEKPASPQAEKPASPQAEKPASPQAEKPAPEPVPASQPAPEPVPASQPGDQP